ncbi:uncharacterized protein [Physcomitrium patens]|uniref:Tify domain-containing protein n=1 Tax=Physcomitrium patens TaxID=3218 RepID=A0A2K1L2B3_PHYPA|nr:uncharacterized protein LOC112273147 [Physcomitrium patens]XP_024357393.1 uncharacterized protein LOC112273147 [Physcomitrium patens]XP_024357400.1 uncharacterized protein LOC112273147 [Physcomitrium patens]PNR60164.1 hypothetical protein PHYPA_002957 [Physcomitrium patens]|eukprot:XP_024357385.1 uncharacterized protein LOC112273147 [Physcomitrella patens]
MAANAEDEYASRNNEAKPGGSWAAVPPIMHSWCLQPDQPASGSESAQNHSSSRLTNDMDDDCGFDLNLGLSLGGGGSGNKNNKPKQREKDILLDRDAFREDCFRAAAGELGNEGGVAKGLNGEETSYGGGVVFKSLKNEQDGTSQSLWQDLDRSRNDTKENGLGGPLHGCQGSLPQQPDWLAGESSIAEDSKTFALHMWQALQGKSSQPEHQRVPLSAQDEASLIKELQGLPPQAVATAAAWARMVARGGFPMQFFDAIKEGVDPATRGGDLQRSLSMKSFSSGSHSEIVPIPSPPMSQQTAAPTGNLERSDSDVSKNMQIDQQQRHVAIIQQQRKRELQTQKRQEARRKRKTLLEGQKSKKAKKEGERAGSSGPCGGSGGKSGLEAPPSGLRRTTSLQPSSGMCKQSSKSAVSSPLESQEASQHGGASSLTAFRRLGSSAWMNYNWEGTSGMAGMAGAPVQAKVEAMHATGGGDGRVESGEQVSEIQLALEKTRDRGSRENSGSGVHVESSSENGKVSFGSPDVVQMQKLDLDANGGGRYPANVSGSREINSHQLAAKMENRENADKVSSGFPGMPRRGDGGVDGPAATAVGKAEKGAKTSSASSQTSSDGTEISDGKDENTNTGLRIDQRNAEMHSTPVGSNTPEEGRGHEANAFMLPASNAMALANLSFSAGGGFPMMPGSFPFPISVPAGGGAGGLPFSMPFPFPYLMQFTPGPPNGGDGNQEQRCYPGMPSPFQIALPPGYPPFQIQPPEGAAAWPGAMVRPHATLPETSPRSSAGKCGQATSVREEEHGARGAPKGSERRSRNTSPAKESVLQGLAKTKSMSSGALNRLRPIASSNPSPLVPQFGLSRSKSDAVGIKKEGLVGITVASLGVEAYPGGSNGQANELGVQSGSKASSRGGLVPRAEAAGPRGVAGAGDDAAPSGGFRPGGLGSTGQLEVPAAQITIGADEDVKRPYPISMWRQGSLPSLDGMGGHEALSLQAGIAAGQQFGGTGSTPDLPWVTCNGTISGVLYRVEKGQVRIVCACHGRHMTPAEFVQHAGCGEIPNPEKAIVMSQQPAPAQA